MFAKKIPSMKAKRSIITIDEQLCNGCGACIEGCHEGALRMIDGKARMVSELYCDGLGACIGECPVGAITIVEREAEPYNERAVMERMVSSQLTHWPVQLHLLNPQAGFFRGSDVVLAADCTAFAYADFHRQFIQGKTLAIACPKLDSNKESYIAKITEMIDSALINTLTVVIMEVPCCGGLMQLANLAAGQATRKVPIKKIVIGVQGEIKEESWM
jgi:NAD-dependent dihydropyrimidine dehydrogenase PreA subunit